MLTPRPETPRRTALKFAILALGGSGRAEMRRWAAEHIFPNGDVDVGIRAPRTWRELVEVAILTVDSVDRRWIRTWLLRWVRDDGSLAIPQRHSGLDGEYPKAIAFNRREER